MSDEKEPAQIFTLQEKSTEAKVAPVKAHLGLRRWLKGHFGKVYAARWTTDSKNCVSASQDGKLIVWNAFTTNKLHVVTLRSSWVMTCDYSPDGTMISAGGLDNLCSIYRLPDKLGGSGVTKEEKAVAELAQHEGYLSCSRFLGNDQMITSSGDSTCILWDLNKRVAKNVFTAHSGDVMSVSLNEVDRNIFVSGSCDTTAKVWDIRKKQCVLSFSGHSSDINAVQFLPDGTAFGTGSSDSTCGLFDLRAQQQLNTYTAPKIISSANSITFARSGRLLIASYEDTVTVQVWDVLLGSIVQTLDQHEHPVSTVQVSPDGQALLTASWDTTLRIYA